MSNKRHKAHNKTAKMHHLEDRVAHHHEDSEREGIHQFVVPVALLAQRLRAHRASPGRRLAFSLQQALRPPGEEAEHAEHERGDGQLQEALLKESQLVHAVGVGEVEEVGGKWGQNVGGEALVFLRERDSEVVLVKNDDRELPD